MRCSKFAVYKQSRNSSIMETVLDGAPHSTTQHIEYLCCTYWFVYKVFNPRFNSRQIWNEASLDISPCQCKCNDHKTSNVANSNRSIANEPKRHRLNNFNLHLRPTKTCKPSTLSIYEAYLQHDDAIVLRQSQWHMEKLRPVCEISKWHLSKLKKTFRNFSPFCETVNKIKKLIFRFMSHKLWQLYNLCSIKGLKYNICGLENTKTCRKWTMFSYGNGRRARRAL